jgi:CubicO group peptidase (beta-lactamase class C family)
MSLTVLGPFVLASAPTASALDSKQINDLLRPVEELRIKADVPGLAIATFTSRGPQLTYASGVTSLGLSAKPVSATATLFPIASVSKLFTTVVVFQLIQQNVFTLDTKLSEFPETPFFRIVKERCPEKMSMLEKIRIRHLLSHQSGIGQDTPGGNL